MVSLKMAAMHFALCSWRLLALTTVLAGCGLGAAAEGDADRLALAVEALTRLEGVDLDANASMKERVLKVLDRTRGTANFVKLVQHFKLKDQAAGLLEVAAAQPASESGVEAMRLVLAGGDTAPVQQVLESTNVTRALKTVEALGHTGDKAATPLLLPIVADSARDVALRKQAVRSLARTSAGAGELLQLAKADKLPDDLKFTAGAELNAVRWPDLRAEAAKLLPPAQGRNSAPLPPIAELARMKGDAANGFRIFTNASPGCANCHVVQGRGVELGPNLSEIGTKLGREALLDAILDPSAGISFGYEAWTFMLKSGDEAYGLIASETADEIAVKNIGGLITRFKKSEIESRQQARQSIMPAGLQAAMSAQELADLVEYLAGLRKAEPLP